MLPVYPFLGLIGAALLLALLQRGRSVTQSSQRRIAPILPMLAIALVLQGIMFQGLALLNVYSQPNTRIQASQWIYNHVKPGSVLTYEQWDDSLPVALGSHTPDIYRQATYAGPNGQQQTGLDPYGDDTTDKARQPSNLL